MKLENDLNIFSFPRPGRLIERGMVVWLIAATFVALILGALISVLPAPIFIGALIVIIVVGLLIVKPYFGILASLALVFEVVPGDLQPSLGKFRAYDALAILLSVTVFLRTFARQEDIVSRMRSIIWPFSYLVLSLCISFLYVKYFFPNDFALSEIRAQFMWMLVPLAAVSIDSRKRFEHFTIGVLIIGVMIAIFVSAQSLLEIHIMTQARVEPLDAHGNSDIVRSIAGGGIYVVIFALFFFVNAMMEGRMKIWTGVPLVMILCLGLAVQYGRGVWVATGVGLLLSAFLYRGWKSLLSVAIVGAVALTLFVSGIMVVKPRVGEALVERVTGIKSEISDGGSFGFRKQENALAIAAISKHPFFGIGIGGSYKPTFSVDTSFVNESTYIHNSWLWYPLKLGIWSSMIPFAFIFCFCRESLVALRANAASKERSKWFIGAVAGAFVVPVIASYTQPEWVSPQGISAISVLIGLMLLTIRWGSPFGGSSTVDRA